MVTLHGHEVAAWKSLRIESTSRKGSDLTANFRVMAPNAATTSVSATLPA